MSYRRYVAIGDSQTEGLNDPDGAGGFRGWADRLADLLVATSPHLQYANLAVRGRLVGRIRAEQLAPALALRPDLVTVMGGLNDLMRPRADRELDAVAAELEGLLRELRASGATVVTNTFPDPSTVAPLFGQLPARVAEYNDRIRRLAERYGVLLVDFDARGVGTDPRIWSPDRVHANPFGHSLIAAAFADTLGVPGQGHWTRPLPPLPPVSRTARAGTELRWLGRDVAPWLLRRLRGHSTGDGVRAKRPELGPVATLFHLVEPDGWPSAGWYRPTSLAAEGFVHLSFADQVARSANVHYAAAAELIAVEVDPRAVPAAIRVEDSYGSGAEFPHAYGPLPVTAALGRHRLGRDAAGDWTFSRPGRAAGAASPDR